MKVQNITSPRGNTVVNQFIILTEEGRYFQSYDKLIAYIPNIGNVQLDMTYWNYSKTTGKYRNKFLNEDKTETLRKINNGIYKLVDLN